jgi:hypothetical protein
MELQSIKKLNNITNFEILRKLDRNDFANLFNVVELGENSYFNISKTIRFDNVDDIPERILC